MARTQLQEYAAEGNRWNVSILSDEQNEPGCKTKCELVLTRGRLAPFHTPSGCLLKPKVWVGPALLHVAGQCLIGQTPPLRVHDEATCGSAPLRRLPSSDSSFHLQGGELYLICLLLITLA